MLCLSVCYNLPERERTCMGRDRPPAATYAHIYRNGNGYAVDVYGPKGEPLGELKTSSGGRIHANWGKAMRAAQQRGLIKLPQHLGGRG